MMMMMTYSPSAQFQVPSLIQSPHKLTKPVAVLPPSISKTNCFRGYIHHKSRNHFFFSAIVNSSSGVEVQDLTEEVETGRSSSTEVGESLLAASGLSKDRMPKHVGIILDGNMRWAKEHNLPASDVHERLLPNLAKLCHHCIQFGIPVLSAFIFSTQNWSRPQTEVDYLMNVFEEFISGHLENFIKQGIRVSFIGDSSRLLPSFQQVKVDVEDATKNNTKLHLIYAMGYSGQYDMMQACQSIANKVKDGQIQPKQIDESIIEQHLQTSCTEFPHPDLVIRTGGKLRVTSSCGSFPILNYFLQNHYGLILESQNSLKLYNLFKKGEGTLVNEFNRYSYHTKIPLKVFGVASQQVETPKLCTV